MKVRKSVNFDELSLPEKASFLGRNPKGFEIVSAVHSLSGLVEVVYTYGSWDFDVVALIIPILDSTYCQVVDVD